MPWTMAPARRAARTASRRGAPGEAGRVRRVQPVGRRPPAVALLPDDPEVSQLQAAVPADEDVQGREVAVQQLPAVQLAQDLEEAGDLAPDDGLRPALARALQEGAEV